MAFASLKSGPKEYKKVLLHCCGKLTAEEKTYIPDTEYGRAFWTARIWALIYIAIIACAISTRSILPLMLIGLPSFYGAWLLVIFGLTQHAGLAEDVLDHRLNCRTVYMNPIFRFVYWNMNYHVEHHMFPMVPYHALPELHRELKDDMPKPYASLIEAYREIIPAILRQVRTRRISSNANCRRARSRFRRPSRKRRRGLRHKFYHFMSDPWIKACKTDDIESEDVLRFDHGGRTFAIYRTADGRFFATDGLCTHAKVHLAGGFVMENLIECPKHNGRFDFTTGQAKGAPACVDLKTYPTRVEAGEVFIQPG